MIQNEQIVNKCNDLLAKLEAKLSDQNKVKNVVNTVEKIQNEQFQKEKSLCSHEIAQIEKIRQTLKNKKADPIFIELQQEEKESELTLIQAFFGTDIRRIDATVRALKNMLKSNPKPQDWIFVEAQTSRQNSVFGWVKQYGIKYEFVKYGKESEGIFLKPSLWNVGARKAKFQKMIFLDSDVQFCSSNWANNVLNAFDKYDVISPAGWSYYADGTENRKLCETIGHSLMVSNGKNCEGHIGFAIGMTKKAYDTMKGFRPCSFGHSNNMMWEIILGTKTRKPQIGWTPYRLNDSYEIKYGLPLKIGSTEQVYCHLDHGNFSKRKYVDNGKATWYGVDIPFSEMTVQENGIPIWSDTHVGKIMKNVNRRLGLENIEVMQLISEEYEREYGKIDEKHPLFIVSYFKPSYSINENAILNQLKAIKEKIKNPFTYVCAVDLGIADYEKFISDIKNQNEAYQDIIFIRGIFNRKTMSIGEYEFENGSSILLCNITCIPRNCFSLPICPAEGLSPYFVNDDCVKNMEYLSVKYINKKSK